MPPIFWRLKVCFPRGRDNCSRSDSTQMSWTAEHKGGKEAPAAPTHLEFHLVRGHGPIGHQAGAQGLLQEVIQLLSIVLCSGA